MKNIMNKVSSPSSFCYFYIILLFTSMLINPSFVFITTLLTVTTTLVSISILWELKKQINLKFSIYCLDFFFIFFIVIKCLLSLGHISFPNFTTTLISHSSFSLSMGILQLIYSHFLIKISNKRVKHLWFYGWLLFLSSLLRIFGSNMGILYVMSIANTYVLSQAFYEFSDFLPRKHKI